MLCKKGRWFFILLHLWRVRRREHFHEIFGFTISCFALNMNSFNIAAEQVADGLFHQACLFKHQRWCHSIQRVFTNLTPNTKQIFKISFDFGFGSLGASGAYNKPHALWYFQILGNGLEAFAVGCVGDFAAYATAACGVGHEHAIAPGQGEVGCKGSTLISTFFFDHLHQNDLATFDDFLNFIMAGFLLGPWCHNILTAQIFNIIGGFFDLRLIFPGSLRCLLCFQRFAVSNRYLVIIWMNFIEGEEAMTLAAILHKSSLQ